MRTRIRYLAPQVDLDLKRKMVFVAGPRQVGKTTLAKALPGAREGYLNWDIAEHRERILRHELPAAPLWVFDEIHKYRAWRGLLKGLFDGRREGQRILVTGSARLDLYRHGGDSLQGRDHLLRLHPLSVREAGIESPDGFRQLLQLGGFPEPFFGGSEREARRWSREYRTRLIRDDIASLERIQDLGTLEHLALRRGTAVAPSKSSGRGRLMESTPSRELDTVPAFTHECSPAPHRESSGNGVNGVTFGGSMRGSALKASFCACGSTELGSWSA